MKVVIKMTKREEAKALPILLRHSPGTVLANRTYTISPEAVSALRKGGIQFEELSRDANPAVGGGKLTGERHAVPGNSSPA
jgi:hypothetical protein